MKNKSTPWYVYMLICRDETIYTGIARNAQKRLAEHNGGVKGAKYTRSRRPVSLVYTEKLPSRSAATSREYQLKRLSRQRKLLLIRSSGYQADS
jgi:putative endonuclease